MTLSQVQTTIEQAIEEAAGLNPAAVSWLHAVKARIADEWMEEIEREYDDWEPAPEIDEEEDARSILATFSGKEG